MNLVITLDEETTKRFLNLAQKQTIALVEEDCEPSDMSVTIQVGASHIFDNIVFSMITKLAKRQ